MATPTKDNSRPCRPCHRHPGTFPSSPARSFSSSSSSSDFEFTVVVSPRKSTSSLCPADELFYKGQLLPLQLSPRISMVRTLILSASTTCSSASSSDVSRDSTGSSTDSLLLDSSCCDSSRPSSVAADHHEYDRLVSAPKDPVNDEARRQRQGKQRAMDGYFGLSKFSSVFQRKEIRHRKGRKATGPGPVKRMSVTAKEVIGKYLRKVKPIYEKLSTQKQHMQRGKASAAPSGNTGVVLPSREERTVREIMFDSTGNGGKGVRTMANPFSHSFSGNLRYPRKGRSGSGASCPSSMRSSPSHSGVLAGGKTAGKLSSEESSMEELQSAIQGAIAHCKNSMLQSKIR
ncbi:hypothetical protein MLD38_027343 [Melastoma candidum]|uniref:Uncharacterized protein n=1 Tax=Melastoma candidum TaxID=119954 RepID=A0ACB9P4Q5_9MYRT|nr:hypothetical protein MLD38_027343 [Melastoma candidum]